MQPKKYFKQQKKQIHMKFTKEQAVESIKGKFADKAKGIDLDRTIDEAVSNGIEMIGENSEMELDAFTAIVEKNVSTALGLAKHLKKDAATELQKQIDELQQKLGLKTPPPPKKEEIKSEDPAIQAILDKMNAMEEKLASTEKEKSISEKRSQLVAKMKESIKDEEWISSFLAEISITEDTDIEAKAKDYVAFYNKTQANVVRRSTTPKKTGESDEASEVKDVVAAAARIRKQMAATRGSAVRTEKTE